MEACHHLPNTNVDDVTNALKMANRRLISDAYMSGGMGDGGGCHPRDNIALSHLSQKLGLSYDWFEGIMMQREKQSEWLADLVIKNSENNGCKVFIAAAGMAAHLAGALAAHTVRPVIGIPIESGRMGGIDSLLSTVMMPPGVPVATVAVGKSGAKNSAILAIQILATSNDELQQKLVNFKEDMKNEVLEKNAKLNS